MAGLESFTELIKDGKVDLVENLHKELMRGNKEYAIKKDAVSLIILTGGSSRWQFFLDMITEEFPYTRIISSSDPEATISRGLGLCYSARLYDCLLYTSDAADDTPCVDLGGRRIIKKKNTKTKHVKYPWT
eukprot:TRINITY_DN22715_c0_g1_i3.p2 TRINITY_DN22715_c0_g1~~TRINITY_DN22715_c0_g1_i3.p2  ORF type:complete len:131 (-),score=26.32 TRINITY_DN22715_c0_g1_i3:39-431(-)